MTPYFPLSPSAPPTPSVAALAAWVERSSLQDLVQGAPAALRARTGTFVQRAAGLLALGASGVPSMLVNRVFLDADAPASTLAALPETLAALRARMAVGPLLHAPDDPEVARALQRAGLVPFRRRWLKLATETAAVPEPRAALPIGPCEAREADAFARLVRTNLGFAKEAEDLVAATVQRPRWHVLVARDGGEVVAAGALFVQGEIGNLGFGATAPSHRGRGLQRALLLRRLRIAHALGCRLVCSETGEAVAGEPNPSEHNLRAVGLRVVSVQANWTAPDARWC